MLGFGGMDSDGLRSGMAFTVEYHRGGKKVGEAQWLTPIPPTRDYAYQGLLLHGADSAVILDEEGTVLARETRRPRDV